MKVGDKAPTRPSYCHPWADGVTHWLTYSLAGIVPLAPGFLRYAAMPHVSGNTPTVSATAPTPHGSIAVRASRDNENGMVTVWVQAEVAGVVGLRLHDEATGCALDVGTIVLDGVVGTVTTDHNLDLDVVHPTVVAQHAFVAVSAGGHTLSVEFNSSCAHKLTASDAAARAMVTALAAAPLSKGLPSAPPFPPAKYPGSWTMDNTTGGAWAGKYGKDGFQLFAFDTALNGGDVVKLPPWVLSSVVHKGTASFVGKDARNTSFLHDPRGGPASLGFVTAGADGSQGTVLDVNITDGTRYKLSMYMVSAVQPVGSRSWSFTKQAIRVMDLATMDPIAPDPLIANAPGGVYLTLSYDRGVRLRVMPIDSDAGWSAVFFDKL